MYYVSLPNLYLACTTPHTQSPQTTTGPTLSDIAVVLSIQDTHKEGATIKAWAVEQHTQLHRRDRPSHTGEEAVTQEEGRRRGGGKDRRELAVTSLGQESRQQDRDHSLYVIITF